MDKSVEFYKLQEYLDFRSFIFEIFENLKQKIYHNA